MTQIHQSAQVGFSAKAEAYERGRPGYPDAAIAALVDGLDLDETTTVVDLGAGTGKLTAQLAPVTNVVAVEPMAAMRAMFRRRLPKHRILEGTAEAIPVIDGYADAITVAQAFHWFDGKAAIPEMHRILRPGGKLGLIWNARDVSVPWVADLMELIKPYGKDTPSYTSGAWKSAFCDQPFFSLAVQEQFENRDPSSIPQIVDHFASISYIAALERTRQSAILGEIASKLGSWHGQADVMFPYRTDLWIYRKH